MQYTLPPSGLFEVHTSIPEVFMGVLGIEGREHVSGDCIEYILASEEADLRLVTEFYGNRIMVSITPIKPQPLYIYHFKISVVIFLLKNKIIKSNFSTKINTL